MIARFRIAICGALALAAALSAQDSNYRYAVTGYGAAGALREEFHRTYPLAPDGRVALRNVNGGVRVAVWDRSEVQIDAVKTAREPETMAATEIVVDARPDFVNIHTDSRDRHHLGNVEYTLTVPRQARIDAIDLVNGGIELTGLAGSVRANSVNGGVKAQGLTGDLDLNTVNGGVDAQFDRLEPGRRVSLSSVNGGVTGSFPSGASAQVSASTVHGEIQNDFNLPVEKQDPGRRLTGTIGAGATPVSLSTVNGGVRIRMR